MVSEVRVEAIVERDGEIRISGLPYKKGQKVKMTVEPVEGGREEKPPLTARQLLDSGLVGMWSNRKDIGDSVAYARYLREQAERRGGRD